MTFEINTSSFRLERRLERIREPANAERSQRIGDSLHQSRSSDDAGFLGDLDVDPGNRDVSLGDRLEGLGIGNVPDQTTLLGSPAIPIHQARRVAAVYVQLPELNKRVKVLEQQVEELGTPDEKSPEK